MSDAPTTKMPTADPSPSVTATDLSPPLTGAPTVPTMADTRRQAALRVAMGQHFGEYELLTEIARGGMGVVYQRPATHARPDRRAQDDPGRPAGEPRRRVALSCRSGGGRQAAASQHRRRSRGRRMRGAALFHDGVHRRASASITKLAQGPLPCKTAARYVAHSRAGGRLRAQARHPPPRFEAVQHSHRRGRRAAHHRLRPGETARPGALRPNPHRRGPGHAELHVARSRPRARRTSWARRAMSTASAPSCTSCSRAGRRFAPPRRSTP